MSTFSGIEDICDINFPLMLGEIKMMLLIVDVFQISVDNRVGGVGLAAQPSKPDASSDRSMKPRLGQSLRIFIHYLHKKRLKLKRHFSNATKLKTQFLQTTKGKKV